MKSFVILLLFAGTMLIMHGIYEQKLKAAKENKSVEYRFIPRTYYEEQLATPDLTKKMGSMFESQYADPWADANHITALNKNPPKDTRF